MRRVLSSLSLLSLVLSGAYGCSSNPYGYAPEYVPLSDEEPYEERGLELSYEEVRRDPMGNQDKTLAWFGLIESIKPVAGKDQVMVAMQLVFHQPRHLCSDQFDSSCRVTISQKAGGPFTAVLTPRPEHRSGRDRLNAGSLLKVYGRVATEYDARGGPIVSSEYYRHWPHGTYVNTRRAGNMRR
jgi:hypothetical protein